MPLDDDIRVLSSVSLFEGFTQEQLRLLAFGAEGLRLSAGKDLYEEGAAADSGYVVVRGRIVLYRERDGERVTVGHAGPGAMLGELALIADTTRLTSARAETDTDFLRLNRKLFRRILEEYPELAFMLHERIVDELQAMVQRIESWRRASGRKAQNAFEPVHSDAIGGSISVSTVPMPFHGLFEIEAGDHRHVVGRPAPSRARRAGPRFRSAARKGLPTTRCGRAGGRGRTAPSRAPGSSTTCRASGRPGRPVRIRSTHSPCRAHRLEAFRLDRRVADHVEQLLVRPDVVLERRDVEIADQDGGAAAPHSARTARISATKSSLWRNFGLMSGSGASPPAGT